MLGCPGGGAGGPNAGQTAWARDFFPISWNRCGGGWSLWTSEDLFPLGPPVCHAAPTPCALASLVPLGLGDLDIECHGLVA